MTATCILPCSSPLPPHSEPWNNTGNQLRPLSCKSARYYPTHPQLTPTALRVLRASPSSCALAQPLANPRHQPPLQCALMGRQCIVTRVHTNSQPKVSAAACECRSGLVFYHWPVPSYSPIASPSRCAPAQSHTGPYHKPPIQCECTGVEWATASELLVGPSLCCWTWTPPRCVHLQLALPPHRRLQLATRDECVNTNTSGHHQCLP